VEPRVRRVLHVDMDAFYASIEQRDNPALRGRPVAVGGHPQGRGVVAAASYEARRFGVHSALPMARALRLCPELVVVPTDFERYRTVSRQVFRIFERVTPLVEALSLDEAYLDVTDNAWQEPLGQVVAQRIKMAIREETGLTASAGVAPNKFLAKIASGWQKPDGLTVIAPGKVEAFLHALPVDALWGVGPKTARKLRALGIERLVDLRACDPARLRAAVGSLAEWLRQLAHGIDPRPVEPHRERKSAGSENTYATDLTDIDEIRAEVARMTVDSAEWLARRDVYARTVTLKVRYSDFTTITRSHTRPDAARDRADLLDRTRRLLDRTEAGTRPIRLLGVSVHNLADSAAAVVVAAGTDPWPRLPFSPE
jgi:DNA polymerase IV